MTPVALALGANLGDRAGTLARACAALSGDMAVTAVSRFHDTAPMGPPDQPRYLNAAVIGETRLSPQALLAQTTGIERALGRRREGPRWGPRMIDIDLILHGDAIIETGGLTLPHPGYRDRDFVLGPLAEIAPDWRDPRDDARIADLYAALRRRAG